MIPGRLLGFVGRAASHNSTSTGKNLDETLINIKDCKSDESPRSRKFNRDNMDIIKRHSLNAKRISIEGINPASRKNSPKIEPAKPATMSILVESPPIVFHGNPQQSTGSLFSAQLKVNVTDMSVVFETLEVVFNFKCTTKKPVSPHCPDCASKTTEISRWRFLTQPQKIRHGEHSFPFSLVIPGHLPATMHGSLAVLEYRLCARATTSTGDTITFEQPVTIKRAIVPGNDKHSIRIFPPTNLTANVILPSVVHPIGEIPIEFRLSGITTRQKDTRLVWRLRRFEWRIEERQKMTSPACPKHAAKLGGEDKGVAHEDVRVIGHEQLKHGWKADYDDGMVEMLFSAQINSALHPLCDNQADNGLAVSHQLVVEMVVSEEWASAKRPNQTTPTGAARVLRTQFNLTLTERMGLGIAWDEEQPPMYDDVPASPPSYNQAQVEEVSYTDSDQDVEHLHLG